MQAAPESAKHDPTHRSGTDQVRGTTAPSCEHRQPWWSRRRRWGPWSIPQPAAFAVWIVAAVAVVALFASTAARLTTDPGTSLLESDTATPVLQAQSIVQGNVLLGGWRMLYDSFWTVEVPYYVIGVLLGGVSPALLYIVPAVLAVLLLVAGGTIARQGLRGGAAAAAVVTLVALIGLPSDVWAVLLLHGAWHIGTMLWCLLAFAGLRSGRWRAGWWGAVLVLTAGLLGDLQTISYGVGAVAGAGILASVRTRRWRSGAPALVAALASVVAAYLLRQLFAAMGAYSIGNINQAAEGDQRWQNLGEIPSWLPRTFGVGTGTWGHNGVPAVLAGVRYAAVAVVVLAVVLALWSVLTGIVIGRPGKRGGDHWRVDDMLLLACLADLAFFVYAAQSNLPGYLRYLAPFVVFGSVLAARTVGRLAARPVGQHWRLPRRVLAAVGATVTVLYAVAFGVTATQPVQPVTGAALAQFLDQRGLTNGMGTYWAASMTTVASHGEVTVRPVIFNGESIVRYGRQSAADWYSGAPFQFLVFDTANPWGGVDANSAAATFGPVAATYRVGTYEVLQWSSPVTVDPTQYFD